MSPSLVRWDKKYREQGLRVIQIENGLYDKWSDVRDHGRDKKYPVLWDKDGKYTKKYKVRSYPTSFLVGPDGKVLWVGFANQWRTVLDRRFKSELQKMKEEAARKKARAAAAGKSGAKGNEPLWLTEKEAFLRARKDGKRVFVFRYWAAHPEPKTLLKSVLSSRRVLDLLAQHYHCVITDHPQGRSKREPRMWARVEAWDKTKYLWSLGPDGRDRVAVDHKVEGRLIKPDELVRTLTPKKAR